MYKEEIAHACEMTEEEVETVPLAPQRSCTHTMPYDQLMELEIPIFGWIFGSCTFPFNCVESDVEKF